MKDTLDTSGTALLLELGHAAVRNQFTPADLKWLTQGGNLAKILPVIRGTGEVNNIKYIIDLDADPYVPPRWTVEEHKKSGQFEWDPAKIKLHLSPSQVEGRSLEGNNLRKELSNVSLLNANCLSFCLGNERLIPEEFKDKAVFFWGTIYLDSCGRPYVTRLYWGGSRWGIVYCLLSSVFYVDSFAAVLVE